MSLKSQIRLCWLFLLGSNGLNTTDCGGAASSDGDILPGNYGQLHIRGVKCLAEEPRPQMISSSFRSRSLEQLLQ